MTVDKLFYFLNHFWTQHDSRWIKMALFIVVEPEAFFKHKTAVKSFTIDLGGSNLAVIKCVKFYFRVQVPGNSTADTL